MSYVLDALRRAEAERARGAVPGLNAQPLAAPAAAPPPRGPLPWPLLSGVGIVLLVLGGGIAWWMARPPAGTAPVAQVPVAQAPVAQVPTAPVPAPAASAAPIAPAPVAALPAAPPPVVAAPAVPAPAARALPAAPPVKPAPVAKAPAPAAAALQPKSASAAPPPAPDRAPAPAPVLAAPAPAPTPPATPERIPPLAELPEALRRDLPALRFGGAMDSPQAAARMLIVNGQVFREGDALAPGLTLQTIRLRSAVFEFRGQRFEAAY